MSRKVQFNLFSRWPPSAYYTVLCDIMVIIRQPMGGVDFMRFTVIDDSIMPKYAILKHFRDIE